jgi:hypothetical protein
MNEGNPGAFLVDAKAPGWPPLAVTANAALIRLFLALAWARVRENPLRAS